MEKKVKKHYFRNFITIIFLIIVGIILDARFLGTKGLEIREYPITNKQIPESINGFKIVHFSDLHYGTTVSIKEVETLVNKINELKPDIIIFTGDLVDYNYKIKEDEKNKLINALSKLDAQINKYAVKGNHDQNNNFISIMNLANFTILNNTSTFIYYKGNTPIRIVGVDDYLEGKQKIDEAFKTDDQNKYYTIFLAHEPDTLTKITNQNINLMLSGHSHNGQVRIPFYGAIYKVEGAKTYYDAKYQVNDTTLFITGGIGTSKYPLRLNDKPSFNFYRLYTK